VELQKKRLNVLKALRRAQKCAPSISSHRRPAVALGLRPAKRREFM
jgi:hypothetical protein